jgi:hypothetical protein
LSFDDPSWLPEDYTGIPLPICSEKSLRPTAKQQSVPVDRFKAPGEFLFATIDAIPHAITILIRGNSRWLLSDSHSVESHQPANPKRDFWPATDNDGNSPFRAAKRPSGFNNALSALL